MCFGKANHNFGEFRLYTSKQINNLIFNQQKLYSN